MIEQRRRAMTRQEIFELELFYEVEPFGPRRDDLRFGMLLAMLHNGIFKQRQDPPAKMEDFVMFDRELQMERTAAREGARAKLRRAMAKLGKQLLGPG